MICFCGEVGGGVAVGGVDVFLSYVLRECRPLCRGKGEGKGLLLWLCRDRWWCLGVGWVRSKVSTMVLYRKVRLNTKRE